MREFLFKYTRYISCTSIFPTRRCIFNKVFILTNRKKACHLWNVCQKNKRRGPNKPSYCSATLKLEIKIMVRKDSKRSFTSAVEHCHHRAVHRGGEAEVGIWEGLSEERKILHCFEVCYGESWLILTTVGVSVRQEDQICFICKGNLDTFLNQWWNI